MPAIDLSRLDREVRQLEALFAVPKDLVRATLEVLDFYAERARRPMAALADEINGRSLNVRAPVLRALGLGLLRQAEDQQAAAWGAAEALWDAGVRETRILACWILSAFGDSRVGDWLEGHLAGLEDSHVLSAAAERGLGKWSQLSGGSYVERLEGWMRSSHVPLQALALTALRSRLDLPELEDMRRAFELLAGLHWPLRGQARAALDDLLQTLARRSPAETTRFLLEALEANRPGAERQARSLLDTLPPVQHERLAAALSSRGKRNL